MTQIPGLAALASIPWHPWHVAVAITAVSAALYLLARVQLQRAKEDWANAYFYSPSTKPKHRARRQRWQDRSWALLACTALGAALSVALYWAGPR